MIRRLAARLGVGAVIGAVLLGGLSAVPASAATYIPPQLFGMHVNTIGVAGVNTGAHSGRLWDTGTSWREIETAEGVYNWGPMDAAVANSRASGMTDLQLALGSTPAWCASKFIPRYDVRGPGSSSYPARDSCWLDYVRAVATRYKGQIQSYQMWNEADRPNFYTGTPEQLGDLTGKTTALLKSIDGSITVAAAGMIPRPGRFGPNSFEERYYKRLQAQGWPVDVFPFAVYPETADKLADYVKIATDCLQRLGAPKKPIWISEANYFSNFGNAGPPFDDAKAATYVARNYIDSINIGITRSYWYSWNSHQSDLGVRMTNDAGVTTGAATAFRNITNWLSGKGWLGCRVDGGVTKCGTTGGTPQVVMYRTEGSSSVTAPPGTTEVCPIIGSCVKFAAGNAITVGTGAVLFKGGVTNTGAVPGLPSSLKAKYANAKATFSWAAPTVGPVTRYEYRTSTNAGKSWSGWKSVGTARSASLNRKKKVTYRVQVRAVNTNGSSGAALIGLTKLK